MTRHFLYFILHSARNGALKQLRRLRQPRYAIAALFGAAYFFFIFSGGVFGGEAGQDAAVQWVKVGRAIGPLFIGILATWWWLWGGYRNALAFMPAETNLLLTAPIRRAELIRFKIMQAQLPVLTSALIGTLLMRGSALPWPLRFLSLWVLLATLHQHQIAASLVHASAEQHGVRGVRRHLIPFVIFGGAFIALAFATLRAVADIRAHPRMEFIAERLLALLSEPGPSIALAPFRFLLAPTLAPSLSAWPLAFAGAVGVLALHYVWVQRTDAAFEEIAAREGERRAARIDAVRAGGVSRLRFTSVDRPKTLSRPLLPLRSSGPAAYAVFWKNVLYVQRSFRALTIVLALVWIVTMLAIMSSGADSPAQLLRNSGFASLAFAGMVTIGGPIAFRIDLRMDLANIDLLRTYPLTGSALVAAEVLSTTVIVTAVQLVLAWGGLGFLLASGALSPLYALGAALFSLVALPCINGIAVTVQNAIALFYPGWVKVGASDSGGMEAVGMNMLVLIATFVLLSLALIPPAIGAAIIGAPLAMISGALAVPAAAVAALLVSAGELVVTTMWLGGIYDNTDPVEAGLLR